MIENQDCGHKTRRNDAKMIGIDSSNMIRLDSTWSPCCPSIDVSNKMKFSRNGVLSEFSPKSSAPIQRKGILGQRGVQTDSSLQTSNKSDSVWSPPCPGIPPSKCHSESSLVSLSLSASNVKNDRKSRLWTQNTKKRCETDWN